jgi:hypothetical protein
MTSTQTPVVQATAAAAVTAVIAVALLLASVVLISSPTTSRFVGHVGLACLFAAPVVRNLVVVWRTRGAVRWLAIVGVVIVAVVFGATLGQALDPTRRPLPTSTT